jgi:hypothetical protein
MPAYKTKCKVTFLDLLRPEFHLQTEVGLGIFTWMLRTGWDFRNAGRWGSTGVFEQAWGLSSTNAVHYPQDHYLSSARLEPFLRLAFARLLLNRTPALERWRKHMGIDLHSSRMVYFPHAGEESYAGVHALQRLLDVCHHTTTFKVSPNSYHPKAVHIYSTRLFFAKDRWHFDVRYGYDGSAWSTKPELRQADKESTLAFAYRCYQYLQPLVHEQPTRQQLQILDQYRNQQSEDIRELVTQL